MKLLTLFSFLIILNISTCFSQDKLELTNYNKEQVEIIKTVQEQIDIISSLESDRFAADDAIEKVLSFCWEEAIIQTKNNVNERVSKYKVKTFLIKLKLIKYSDLIITEIKFDKKNKILFMLLM